VSGALDPLGAGGIKRDGKRNEAVSKTKKIVNMLADDTSAPAAARTLAKAAEQQGKLIALPATRTSKFKNLLAFAILGSSFVFARRR